MGLTRIADVPGNVIGFNALVASAASNGTGSGEQLVRCPQAGYLYSAGIVYTSSQNSAAASDAKTVKVINLGSAAAGRLREAISKPAGRRGRESFMGGSWGWSEGVRGGGLPPRGGGGDITAGERPVG